MQLRLLQIAIMLAVLMTSAVMVHAAEAGVNSGYSLAISFDAGFRAAPGVNQRLGLVISVPDDQHSAPCYLECQHPFLRSLSPAQPVQPDKYYLIAHWNGMSQTDRFGARSGWLSGQFNILLFNPPGSPYQEHRARTGRQLT